MLRRGCGTDQLRDTIGDAQSRHRPRRLRRAVRVGLCACRDEIALGPLDDLSRKVLVRGHALLVGVGEPRRHHVQPGVELVVTTHPDLDAS